MQPDLDEHHPLGREPRLPLHDLTRSPLPFGRVGETLDALDEDAPVPGAVEHGHAAPSRERRREAVQEVVAALVRAGWAELRDAHVARVEHGDEPPDAAALARRGAA